jgi:hypothetical protein
MTPLEQQLQVLKDYEKYQDANMQPLPGGAHLIEIPNVPIPPGWNVTGTKAPVTKATILFIAPAGYPAAKPDCFWLQVTGLRFNGEGTPNAANENTLIPGLTPPRPATWFSWHVQTWDPNKDSLATYMAIIMQRLKPAR